MHFCKESGVLRCWITAFDQREVMIVSGEDHKFYTQMLSDGSAGVMTFCKDSNLVRC